MLLVASPAPVGAFWKKRELKEEALEYGADISFPMQHARVSTNYPWLPHNTDSSIETPEEYKDMPIQPLGDKQSFYDNYVQGCVEQYENKGDRCLNNERDRIAMTLRQPMSMRNYTEHGFAKIRAPEPLMELLYKFWNANNESQTSESWPGMTLGKQQCRLVVLLLSSLTFLMLFVVSHNHCKAGNTYVNHWQGDSYMISVEDASLEHGGYLLKQLIWNGAKSTIEEWTGQQMAECSLYGIRVYKEGAVLAPRELQMLRYLLPMLRSVCCSPFCSDVDRLPLVSSAIINVAQDVDEPWPLEVIGHDGNAHNVTMVPGDLVRH